MNLQGKAICKLTSILKNLTMLLCDLIRVPRTPIRFILQKFPWPVPWEFVTCRHAVQRAPARRVEQASASRPALSRSRRDHRGPLASGVSGPAVCSVQKTECFHSRVLARAI
jgi:hypothetical protein